ncbi:MAG: cobalt transporter CbiM [Methanobrevibacter sp.]|jgi:cobalt/nickel transport system permease protein|nr:cobalt transporter CbiM [Candidatus Methanovirga australis]
MHIPDGFIPISQCIVYYVIVIFVGYFAVNWAKNNLDEKQIPLLSVLGAGVFAIMSMNIPIPWGTSGHMIGSPIVSILLGSPFAGFLVMTVVLIIQALAFGDGGVTVLGANIFNMGIIASFLGFYIFKALKPLIHAIPSVFIGSFLAIFITSIACALELFIAGTFPLTAGLVFMGLYHFVIGIVGEGIISAIVYMAINNLRPDLISKKSLDLKRED